MFLKGLLAALVAVMGAVNASAAALDLATVTVDTAPVFTLAITILTALAAMWVIRKAIKLSTHS